MSYFWMYWYSFIWTVLLNVFRWRLPYFICLLNENKCQFLCLCASLFNVFRVQDTQVHYHKQFKWIWLISEISSGFIREGCRLARSWPHLKLNRPERWTSLTWTWQPWPSDLQFCVSQKRIIYTIFIILVLRSAVIKAITGM